MGIEVRFEREKLASLGFALECGGARLFALQACFEANVAPKPPASDEKERERYADAGWRAEERRPHLQHRREGESERADDSSSDERIAEEAGRRRAVARSFGHRTRHESGATSTNARQVRIPSGTASRSRL